jgi:zinc protease
MKRTLLTLLLLPGLALAASLSPRLDVPVERYQLPNGLTVILHEDHRLPTVVVDLWFRVGSKDEKAGRSGFAHLFEHLMFMGTRAVPNGEFDSIMEAVGGQNNATTSEDRTNYFEFGPSNLLETFLWLEADRLATLPDDMTKEKVDLQRDVVKNERRQSYENRPYGVIELELPERMFPEGHPYHHPVIGSHADLTAASVDDVKRFFRDYYVPSNASLVVAGDFQAADAKKMIEKFFAPLAKVPVPAHAAPKPGKLAKSERVTLKDAVKLDRVTMAWRSPASFEPGDGECDLIAAALGSGKSSRLYKSLVYKQKLAQQVQVEQRSLRYGGLFVVTATAQPGHSAAELEKAIDAEIAALGNEPLAPAEVDRARTIVETQLLRSIEPPFGLADLLNFFEFRFGDARELPKRLLDRYDRATPADVVKQAKALFAAPHATLQVVPK